MIGAHVIYRSAKGAESNALVLHEHEHEGEAPPQLNVVIVSDQESYTTAVGRAILLKENVPHQSVAGEGKACWLEVAS